MIRLRISKLDDNHLYRLIIQQLLPLAKIGRPLLVMDRKTIFENLNKCKVLVIARQGRPLFGFISVQVLSRVQVLSSVEVQPRILKIEMFAIEQTSQGKGWGSLLMDKAESYGRRKGCEAALVWVDEQNEAAQAFYVKKGYEIEQYSPEIHCFLLSKSL